MINVFDVFERGLLYNPQWKGKSLNRESIEKLIYCESENCCDAN